MDENVNPQQSLGATAYWTASARAQESSREDKLFDDPWAAVLAGEQGAQWLAQRSGTVAAMVIRTRYFDDFLQQTVRQNSISQIVILAAGLDTRAYRLDWPEGTQFYELDQPAVLRYKAEILQSMGAAPNCHRQAIEVDLTAPWASSLIHCGFNPDLPSIWLLEGILFYLDHTHIVRILDEISRLSAAGSWLGFDIVNSTTLTSPITRGWVEMQARAGAPWIGSLDDPEAFLQPRGWQTRLTQPGSPDANFGRWTLPIIPLHMPGLPHNWYITAEKVQNETPNFKIG